MSQPYIDVTQIEKGKTFIFTAEVAVKPVVVLGEYKGVEVRRRLEVTDEEIQAELLKKARRIIPEHRRRWTCCGKWRQVVLDFEGFVDGEAFQGGRGAVSSDYRFRSIHSWI